LKRIFLFLLRFSDLAYRLASPKNIVIFLALLLLLGGVVIPHYARQISPGPEQPLLDARFGFSPAEAYEALDAFGEEGRRTYLFFLAVFDSVYPLVYGGVLILLASFFLRPLIHPGNEFRIINLLAIDAVIFDYVENLGIIYMIRVFPSRADGVALLVSVAGMIKWVVVALALALIVIAAIRYFSYLRSGPGRAAR